MARSMSYVLLQTAEFSLFHTFAGSNGDLEPVLGRRIRALIRRVVVTVRDVGTVEVDLVDAGAIAIEVHEPAGRIRLGAAREIAERYEQTAGILADLVEGRQLERLA